ncbi:MAG: alpha-1,4-glucan--maltose-1-phosphate maltosyltransferase [Planctomycetes bacterium]|nr:alpha-1,4-glucan--maltose-1-phosphate maltosyltransferase [Planctomycetota bacterium]
MTQPTQQPRTQPTARTEPGHGRAAAVPLPEDGRRRVAVEGLRPEVDGGRFPIKRARGEEVVVEVDAFADGHDLVKAALLHRHASEREWLAVPMKALGNDRWRASFRAEALGRHLYAVRAWVDDFATWRRGLGKKVDAGQDVTVDLQIGADVVRRHARATQGAARVELERAAAALAEAAPDAVTLALSAGLLRLVEAAPDLRFATTTSERAVVVDPPRAVFSTWYELFPRSAGPSGQHGTLRDVEARLDEVVAMGFDVLYLPPIHPIGRVARKGKNNAVEAGPDDVGSPWAIGAAEGGHTAVHPQLGTVDDLRRLVARARERGVELALDVAFQCAPDHPWVTEHPGWFRRRPDGSIQYAENPPKKYQDIYPFDFECDDWQALWAALRDVVLFWVEQGVVVFRVDNPHTKPLPFWEWLIGEVKARRPEVVFLSEAFTRPRVMERLAKLGFTQSYTYFTWRNTSRELTDYFEGMARAGVREYLRPNLWPNTPDILPEALQMGGRPAFVLRLVLAATLGASYGVYGPAFELCEGRAREPGSEEYLDSEKYQLRAWDLDAPHSLREVVARVNRIRREHRALQTDRGLRFHPTDNEQLLCYSKRSDDGADVVVVVANLDPHHRQSGWLELPLARLTDAPAVQMHDLLGGGRYLWSGERHFVQLDPHAAPAHVFAVRRRVRTEQDFDYYL